VRTKSRIVTALSLAGASVGLSLALAAPASACTGDACDAFCYAYGDLPATVQQKVFRSPYCPIE